MPRTFKKVLAGPVVRRVGPETVNVWLALSQKPKGDLTLRFSGGGVSFSGPPARVVRLGKQLWVALVRWVWKMPGPLLEERTIYRYDVYDGEWSLLTELLVGLDGNLPSFMLPNPVEKGLRVAQASCRKPHGGGYDALALLGAELQKTADDPARRPQQLFLTGDQIYADDVAEPLLKHLSLLTEDLFGYKETLGDAAGLSWSAKKHVTPREAVAANQLDRSGFLVEAGFKSATSRPEELAYYVHHLLGFQEWCAMYLLAWSSEVWAGWSGPGLLSEDAAHARVETYRCSLPQVSLALANVATYMIFDDHDVTDDWFMAEQREAIIKQGKPLARSIVRNGLLAYVVFQDWGNNPDDYADPQSLGSALLKAVEYAGAGKPPGFLDDPKVLAALGLTQATAASFDSRKSWHYQVVGPDFDVVVLDTRTWRGSYKGKESLLTDWAMQQQLELLYQNHAAGAPRPCVLVSPAPIAGFLIVELGQRGKMVYRHAIKPALSEASDVALDFEGWHINGPALKRLLGLLREYEVRPIVLSGDVHYAYSELARGAGERTWRLLQLCSSSAKNSEALTRMLGLCDILSASYLNPMNKAYDIEVSADELDEILAALKMNVEGMGWSAMDWLGEKAKHKGIQLFDLAFRPDIIAEDALTRVITRARSLYVETHNIVDNKLMQAEDSVAVLDLARRAIFGKVYPDLDVVRDQLGQLQTVQRGFGPGADGVAEMLTSDSGSLRFEPVLATDSLVDKRGAPRFAGDADVKDWYAAYGPDTLFGEPRDRSAFLDWLNFLSVGDTNIGLVDIKKSGKQLRVTHELRWTLPGDPSEMPLYALQLPDPADHAQVPPWAVTLHTVLF